MATTRIDPDAEILTLINVFQVAPERQHELVRLLEEATDRVIRHRPGFISANIHAGTDGVHVANYAQWRSRADFDAMLADPLCRKHMTAAAELAEDIRPQTYTVASVHHA